MSESMRKEQSTDQKTYQFCLRCGKKLVSPENRERGMGKVCWEKSKVEKNKQHQLF